MRAIFGIMGLLVVAALVGLLIKNQAPTLKEIKLPTAAASAAAGSTAPADINPSGNVKEQSQQIQQQVKSAVDAAVNQARPVAEEK
jgi:hypothetical protein